MKRAFSVILCLSLAVACVAAGCDSSDPGDPASGEVTFGADEGVDLFSGKVRDPGNYANSDLFASANGDGLKLSTGGEDIVHSRPVNWFKTGGGVAQRFDSLAEVPTDPPADGAVIEPLINARTGNGFVVERADGGYTRGWIKSADTSSVTIEFAPLE